MRQVFDDHEVERAHPRHETELTLGSGTLLAIFLGLVVLCCICFGMGYSMGHRSSGPSAASTPQAATEQEPLQATGAIPKPSAIAETPVAPPAETGDQSAAGTAAQPAAASGDAQAPGTAPESNPSASQQAVHPALPPQSYMVQIAAVSNPVDADVLVGALRRRNYPVTVHRDPGDNLIHVRIGPFATQALAEQWKSKLLSDGYNAIVQP